MGALVVGPFGVEMSSDPAFRPRVRRLALVSAVMLGWIWALVMATLDADPAIELTLLLGWIGMAAVLGLSLRLAWIRRFIAFPSVLVVTALVAVCLIALPDDHVARVGWFLLTAGILLGAGIGAWFWYRWLPVPKPLDAPFAPARWALIAVHVGLLVGGLLLIEVRWLM